MGFIWNSLLRRWFFICQAQRRTAAKTVRASTYEGLLNGDQAGLSAKKHKGAMISHTHDTITCKKKRVKLMTINFLLCLW